MKNKPKIHQAFNSLMRRSFSLYRIPLYIILSLLFIISNLFFVPFLFARGNNYINADGLYIIFIGLSLTGVFILLSVMAPLCLMKINTGESDGAENRVSAQLKILALWIPLCLYVIAQMLVFAIFSLISPEFNVPLTSILLTCAALCALVFVWIIICSCLYFAAKSVLWYFIGLLAVNFAPIIISWGCHGVYYVSSFEPYTDWNPLHYNLFIMSGASINRPWVFLTVAGVVIGLFVLTWFLRKKYGATNLSAVSTCYKIIVILSISLSCGFVLSRPFMTINKMSLLYVFCFSVIVLSAAALFAFLAFRKNKLKLRLGLTALSIVISCALVLGGIPAKARYDAYILPDAEEIESVYFFLDSIESFETEEDFENCIELHETLLDLFKEGYLPDKQSQPYKEPECLADLWDVIHFGYKLKDGSYSSRYYSHLSDPVFDAFYIEFLKSDTYLHSLQKTKPDNPAIRYFYSGSVYGRWCELPEECMEELINTYCNELKNADKSAFYEEFEIIELEGVYELDRRIYVPLSFTDTRNLAEEYLNTYRKSS